MLVCLNNHLYKAAVIRAGSSTHTPPPPPKHLLHLFSFIHNTTVRKEGLEPL